MSSSRGERVIFARVQESEHREFAEAAASEGVTLSQLVRRALRVYVEGRAAELPSGAELPGMREALDEFGRLVS